MLKKLVATFALLLTACGTTPYPWEVLEPTNGCLGPYYVKNNQGTLNRTELLKNENILKYLFTHTWSYTFDGGVYVNGPFFNNNKEFCDSFGGVHITYEWNWDFPCWKNQCWGLTTPTEGIFLEYSGRALAHEFIHVYEEQNGVINTADHPNWDLKGYNYLNNTLWYSEFFPPMTGPDGGIYPTSFTILPLIERKL